MEVLHRQQCLGDWGQSQVGPAVLDETELGGVPQSSAEVFGVRPCFLLALAHVAVHQGVQQRMPSLVTKWEVLPRQQKAERDPDRLADEPR